MNDNRVKIVIFGKRHTGQGPIGRSWGKTTADLPDLQPVIIYSRKVNVDGNEVIIDSWILSLDNKFDYMRNSMYMRANAFVYTIEATELPNNVLEMLSYLDPFIDEVHECYQNQDVPLQFLVGTIMDPTRSILPEVEEKLKKWVGDRGIRKQVFINITCGDRFHEEVERLIMMILDHLNEI